MDARIGAMPEAFGRWIGKKGREAMPHRRSRMLTLPCDCGCCMLVVEKTIWDDGDLSYNISMQDSRYDYDDGTLWGRIRNAFKVLFGKPIYYNDVSLMGDGRYRKLVADMRALIDDPLDDQPASDQPAM